jgi:hypothetical protein
MKKDVDYKQCRLQKETVTQVAWIPEKFAKVDMVLEIKGDDGWIVRSAGTTVKDSRAVKLMEKAHRNHRKGCDI